MLAEDNQMFAISLVPIQIGKKKETPNPPDFFPSRMMRGLYSSDMVSLNGILCSTRQGTDWIRGLAPTLTLCGAAGLEDFLTHSLGPSADQRGLGIAAIAGETGEIGEMIFCDLSEASMREK